MEEFERNNRRIWSWFIFRYNPYDSDVVTYKDTGWQSGKLSFNFAHKLAYVYFILFVFCLTLIVLMANGTIKV
jgi:uncharacterized membrane protein